MRKFFLLLAAILLTMSCSDKKPRKSPEQIKAERRMTFKIKATKGIEDYLKRNISSDPDYGRILEVRDTTLNDSMYYGYMCVAVKNVFGAVQQLDGYLFCVCKKNSSCYMNLWEGDLDFRSKFFVSETMKHKKVEWSDIPNVPPYDYVIESGTPIK